MILLPAVDIRDGKAVRLRQGRFDDETVSPIAVTLPVDVVFRHSTAPVPADATPGRPLTPTALEDYLASRWKPSTIIVA